VQDPTITNLTNNNLLRYKEFKNFQRSKSKGEELNPFSRNNKNLMPEE